LISVAIGVVVLAAIGLYLLVAAAVVVIGWLVKVAMAAYARHQAERDRMVSVLESEPAYIPFAQAGGTADELLSIAPRAFDEWIRQFPFAPAETQPLIRAIAYREHRFARLTSEYEARRIVHRTGRCSGRHPAGALRGTTDFDAWSISDEDLRARTIRAEACGHCSGSGRITCVACSGSGRSRCAACNGAGKAYGYAKNNAYRLLNCKACRGRGSLDCSCVAGRVACRTCEGSGRVDGWLAIERATRVDVRCDTRTLHAAALPWLTDGAADDVITRDAVIAKTLSSSSTLPASQTNEIAVENQLDPASVVFPRPTRDERVRGQKLEVIAIPEVAITYQMNGRAEDLSFFGRRMLGPTRMHSRDRLAESRSRLLRRVLGAGVALPLIAAVIYAARGAYFWSVETALLILMLTIASGAAFGAAWLGTLGRRASRTWAVLALFAFVASAALAVIVEPDLGDARELLSRGDLDAARMELLALGVNDPEEEETWADLTLAVTRTKTSPADAALAAAEVPRKSAQRQLANRHVDTLVTAAIEAALASDELGNATAAITKATDDFASDARRRRVAVTLYERLTDQCLVREDWPGAIAAARREESFGSGAGRAKVASSLHARALATTRLGLRARTRAARAEHAATAEQLWGHWQAVSGTDPPRSFRALQIAHQRDVERQRAEIAARERADRRRSEALARAETRRSEARERQRRERAAVETTVYVTRTGSKYHRGGCRYLRSSAIATSLADARHSYSACSVCF
jgi:hypothetical protein